MKEKKKNTDGIDGVDAYNIITDTVGGVNIRAKDNIMQLVACAIGLFLGGGIGLILGGVIGGVLGCVLGVIAGIFLSGIYLMIYRFVMHLKGKHK